MSHLENFTSTKHIVLIIIPFLFLQYRSKTSYTMFNSGKKKLKKANNQEKPKSTYKNPNSCRDSNQNIIQEKENAKFIKSTEI